MKRKFVNSLFGIILIMVFVTKINISKKVLPELVLANIEALAQVENKGEYNVMHFDCFDTEGKRTGKCTGASFTGPNGSRAYHSHTCSYCCQ